MIQVKQSTAYFRHPCGSVSASPSTAPDGCYSSTHYALGNYVPLEDGQDVAPEPGNPLTTLNFDAETFRWALRNLGDEQQPFIDREWLCACNDGESVMRAVKGIGEGFKGSTVIPRLLKNYFLEAARTLPLVAYTSGWAVIIDPVTQRALWFRTTESGAKDTSGLITHAYHHKEPVEAGFTRLPKRRLVFDAKLTQRMPKGTACYGRTGNTTTVWHSPAQLTAVAAMVREEDA